MKIYWVLGSMSVLVSMGVAIIVFGQRKLIDSMSKHIMLQFNKAENLRVSLEDKKFVMGIMQKNLEQTKTTVEDLKTEMSRLTPEEQKSKTEREACRTEMTKMKEELAGTNKEQVDTEANLKTEIEAWTEEISTLSQQMQQRSKVCDFVKNNKTIQNLCDTYKTAAADKPI